MPRERSRYRDRRSSSSESDSLRARKKSKSTKHRRRSRSRDRSESSHRRRRSSSRTRQKRRSYSRSLSRDRYESKSKRRSSSRSRSKRSRRSLSREQSRTRSSSRTRSKHNKSSKKSRRRSRSSSSRSSFDIGNVTSQMFATDDLSELLDSLMQLTLAKKKGKIYPTASSKKPLPRKENLDDTETKLEKAIKAAEAAGLTMTKIPTYEYKEVEIKEEMPTIHDRNLIAELNSDSFVPKTFSSSRNKKQSQNILIDLNTQTVKVPDSESSIKKDDSIIDFDEIPPEEDLKEMWIKKLYLFRKKMLKGEL